MIEDHRMRITRLVLPLALALATPLGAATHLFILSGQSNMARLEPDRTFTPAVTKAMAPDEVIVVKEAQGGQPIWRWYKDWKPSSGKEPKYPEAKPKGEIYDNLMVKVNEAIQGKDIDTVTFVWMQGERDAKGGYEDVYEQSFKGLIKQLETDLSRDDISVVYGRLSDHEPKGKEENWTRMRELQVAMAEANPHWEWVDTDDLNDHRPNKPNDLHYSKEGYDIFGERLAEKAAALAKAREAE